MWYSVEMKEIVLKKHLWVIDRIVKLQREPA